MEEKQFKLVFTNSCYVYINEGVPIAADLYNKTVGAEDFLIRCHGLKAH